MISFFMIDMCGWIRHLWLYSEEKNLENSFIIWHRLNNHKTTMKPPLRNNKTDYIGLMICWLKYKCHNELKGNRNLRGERREIEVKWLNGNKYYRLILRYEQYICHKSHTLGEWLVLVLWFLRCHGFEYENSQHFGSTCKAALFKVNG